MESCLVWIHLILLKGIKDIMKDLYQFNLSVLIEKNRHQNEKKLNTEIEKLFSKNPQLRDIKIVQSKKTK